MKVSIIGGGGLVGSSAAYALQCGGVVSHVCLIDANKDMALGQATDLLHGASLVADQRISAGDYDEVKTSDVIVITAGLRRKPEESRLDLVNRNVDLFLSLLEQVKAAGLKDDAYLVVVSNPVRSTPNVIFLVRTEIIFHPPSYRGRRRVSIAGITGDKTHEATVSQQNSDSEAPSS